MLEWASALTALLLAGMVGSAAVVVATDARRRRRPAIRVGAARRLIRWSRAGALRAASGVLGWPHMVDVALGTRSTAVAPTPTTLVAQIGGAQLLHVGTPEPASPVGDPVIVVHSLVTRPWVLDLTPERTMLGHLDDAGFDVWLLDWGQPTADDAERGLDAYVAVLGAARQIVEERTRRRSHVVGYCLGATIAIIHAATSTLPPASLALVAPVAEIAISQHSGRIAGIGRYIVLPWSAAGLVLDHRGLVPGAVIREAFHLLRPRALRTVWSRLRMPAVPELRRAYGAMARWAWEQPPLPGAVFLDLVELHRSNALARSAWMTSSGRVDLDRLTMPILVTYSERDHIVASRAAFLTDRGAEHVGFPGGHVGMLVGRDAPLLYDALSDFLGRNAAVGQAS